MRKLLTTRLVTTKLMAAMALLVLMAGPPAIAQTGTGGSSANTSKPAAPLPAPVGHRQPRADQVPSEQNLSDPNNPVNKEDAALDRKIKSICRGC
jgi:hypothetical protein